LNPWAYVLTKNVLRAIASRLLLCAAVMMAAPIAATGAPGGSSTAQIDAADQVALGAAKPAEGRLYTQPGRKPDLGARLSVVLGLVPGQTAAPVVPTWSILDDSRPAPIPRGQSVASCKTSRGPPPDAAIAS
jgi:hypothetical protein